MSDDKHVPALDEKKSHKKGCVTKHTVEPDDRCHYRSQGYKEMSTARKEMYNIDFTVAANKKRLPKRMLKELKSGHADDASKPNNFRTPTNPGTKKNKTAWWFVTTAATFKAAKGKNYGTAYVPFNHNYHHIMPDTSLAKELPENELKLLQMATYNLNGPENMIILPCTKAYGVAMLLPDHPGGHPTYNTEAGSILKEIKAELASDPADPKTHKITNKNKVKVKDALVSWQKRMFRKIVNYGKTLPDLPKADTNLINGVPMANAVPG